MSSPFLRQTPLSGACFFGPAFSTTFCTILVQKSTQNGPQMVPRRLPNRGQKGTRIETPKWAEKGTKMDPKMGPKMPHGPPPTPPRGRTRPNLGAPGGPSRFTGRDWSPQGASFGAPWPNLPLFGAQGAVQGSLFGAHGAIPGPKIGQTTEKSKKT